MSCSHTLVVVPQAVFSLEGRQSLVSIIHELSYKDDKIWLPVVALAAVNFYFYGAELLLELGVSYSSSKVSSCEFNADGFILQWEGNILKVFVFQKCGYIHRKEFTSDLFLNL